MGMLKESLETATHGIKHSPNHSGGRVALARVLGELGQYESAIEHASQAIKVNPENILAHTLKAEFHLALKQYKEALKAYRLLQFVSPDNAQAKLAINQLEAVTTDDTEAFSMKPLNEVVNTWNSELEIIDDESTAQTKAAIRKSEILARITSLADAYIIRNDYDKALQTLNEGESQIGPDPEIIQRLRTIHTRNLGSISFPKTVADLQKPKPRTKIKSKNSDLLQSLRKKFNAKRFTQSSP